LGDGNLTYAGPRCVSHKSSRCGEKSGSRGENASNLKKSGNVTLESSHVDGRTEGEGRIVNKKSLTPTHPTQHRAGHTKRVKDTVSL